MEKHLTWNKGTLDANYKIYEAGKIICTIFFDIWKNEAQVIGLQTSYLFKNDGFFNPITQIYNDKNEIIGTITYDTWKTKGKIVLNSGEQFVCEYKDMWHSKWTITNCADKQISYDSSSSTGRVVANTDDELLLLAGFYIRECFNKSMMIYILLVVLVPILTRNI